MNNKLISSLGFRIRFCRDTAKLSQDALAGRLGVTQRTIIKWEKDETIPKLPVLKEISEITGFSYEWINEGKGEERKPKAVVTNSETEDDRMLQRELLFAQRKIISLMEENALLKERLLKNSQPLAKKKSVS